MTKKIDIKELKAKISYEELYDLYITQNKNKQYICNLFNLSDREFRNLVKEYNINKSKKLKNNNLEYVKLITKDEIYNLYITQNKSKEYLCKKLKITDYKLRQILKYYNISKNKILNRGTKNIDRDILYRYYIIENKEAIEIQKMFNLTERNFFSLLHKYNIYKIDHNYEENKKLSEKIRTLYIDQNLSQKEVCKVLGITLGKLLVIRDQFNIIKSKEQIEKVKEKTYKEKYGVIRPIQVKKIAEKAWQKRKTNGTTNTSRPEDQIAFLLKSKFHNVERQYKSNLYPFACDFYIPSLNLYIEFQGNWTHGKEAYDQNNIDHFKLVNKWKKKVKDGHKYYKGAIDVWTVRDPLKRDTAKKNGLNWIEFFSLDEFLSWFRTQSGTPLLVYSPL